MTRIEQTFAKLKQEGRKGFIAYITAGDPSLDGTLEIVQRLEEIGVDFVELGVPFSDPLADGRVNQEAAERALKEGATLDKVIESVAALRAKTEIPLIFFSYLNPFYAVDFDQTIAAAAQAGIDGMLLLDLPLEEFGPFQTALQQNKLNTIRLVTPNTPEERFEQICGAANGFIYCVSCTGVTGMRQALEQGSIDLLERTRRHTELPRALGFGIASPDHACEAARHADAVVVGSAIVKRFHDAPHNTEGRRSAAAWVAELVHAVKEVQA